ncbi:MAG: DUF2029 domain-containing protein [Rubrobacter sp.]|nr:DUF2029 domain-containing protein [Rubrobacter sp.]
MYTRLLGKVATLPEGILEGSNDLSLYRAAGEALLRGEVPYRDFFIEYPPASLPFFVPPALFSGDPLSYIDLFTAEMALLLVACLALISLTARRTTGTWGWLLPAVTFAWCTLLLYPVAATRYDAVVAFTLAVAVAVAALGGRWRLLAYASLGLGTAAKLVPMFAVPALALARRSVLAGGAVFSGVVALFVVPALLLGGGEFLRSFSYHAQRGLQAESLMSSVLILTGNVTNFEFDFGAFEARGPGTDLASTLSLPLTGVLLIVTLFFMYRAHKAGRLGPETFPRFAAALILAFMLGSKVLSPQYMVWLLPLVPLAARGYAGAGVCALFVVSCWATTQVFPLNYDQLLALQAPGPGYLVFRNVTLVVLWMLLLVLPAVRTKDPV